MRIQSRAAAAILGVSQRTIQSLAIAGELPGAARIGGTWTFDAEKLTAFVKQRERDAERVVIPFRAPKPQPRPTTSAKVAAAYAALMASRSQPLKAA
jgi:excisionase family DNA binding protein